MQYSGKVKGASGAIAEIEWKDKPPKLYSVLTFPEQPKAKLVVVSSASPTSVYCMVLHSPGKIARGQLVIDTHQPVSIPVGKAVLGRAMDIFGRHNISIASVVQKERHETGYAPVVILTQKAKESEFVAARRPPSIHPAGWSDGRLTTAWGVGRPEALRPAPLWLA